MKTMFMGTDKPVHHFHSTDRTPPHAPATLLGSEETVNDLEAEPGSRKGAALES